MYLATASCTRHDYVQREGGSGGIPLKQAGQMMVVPSLVSVTPGFTVMLGFSVSFGKPHARVTIWFGGLAQNTLRFRTANYYFSLLRIDGAALLRNEVEQQKLLRFIG